MKRINEFQPMLREHFRVCLWFHFDSPNVMFPMWIVEQGDKWSQGTGRWRLNLWNFLLGVLSLIIFGGKQNRKKSVWMTNVFIFSEKKMCFPHYHKTEMIVYFSVKYYSSITLVYLLASQNHSGFPWSITFLSIHAISAW